MNLIKIKIRWNLVLDYILLAGVIAWTVFLLSNSPEEFVASLEKNEGYILPMLIAFFGELAVATFISVYPSIVSLTVGGLHPIPVGISAAIGLTLANIVYFYLGYRARDIAKTSSRLSKYINYILNWINRGPKWLMPIFIWAFVGLTPLPNNLLTASTGLINYPFKKTLLPLFLGNITLMIMIGYISINGSKLFGR